MDELEKKLQYSFKDRTLLMTALSHSSFANENKGRNLRSNERMEFLGDSVLGLVVASYLFQNCPEMSEGQMTRLRAELVCEQNLYETAKLLDLGRFLKLGKGEEHSGGRQRESILADTVEALIASMYLDGGLDVAKRFIESYFLTDIGSLDNTHISDYKTAIQEFIQRTPGQNLSYELVSQSGPDHNKTFTSKVMLNGKEIGQGKGRTKKEAEQQAAKSGLEELSK